MFTHLKAQAPEASGDLDKIQDYYHKEYPGNQQGYPAHLEEIAVKLRELGVKYPSKKAIFDGAAATYDDLATPDWMKKLEFGGRRRTRKHRRRVRKTRRV